jgi:hypothetical protein
MDRFWMLKGTILALWLFSFGWLASIARLYLTIKKLTAGRGPGIFGVELLLPISNPSFWLWLVVCFGIGLLVARSWPGRPVVWIGLAVTEIIPIGLLTMVLVLVSRTRAMMK